ncbi:hypothetical protein GOODEAATRI_027807, partial [Goodea atripinnis]
LVKVFCTSSRSNLQATLILRNQNICMCGPGGILLNVDLNNSLMQDTRWSYWQRDVTGFQQAPPSWAGLKYTTNSISDRTTLER